jgi:hypothetical protein
VTQLHRDGVNYHLGISFSELSGEEGRADVSGRQNALFIVTGLRDLRPFGGRQLVKQGFLSRELQNPGHLSISNEKPLNLKTGYRMTLRSRLVQSVK